ncbi:hypothetical protein E2320_014436 [Naja naja]|nr:hypothetical protein E2320_014436 [Naja naja]
MQGLPGGEQKEVKTEPEDSEGDGKGKKPKAVQKGLQATHAGTGSELQFQKLLKPIKQEPEDERQQLWETQWQKFLKTMQAPCCSERCPHLARPPPEEIPKEFRASFPSLKGIADTKLRSSREKVFNQKTCRTCEKDPHSSVQLYEEVVVNSPKAELDPSDTEEPGNSTEVECDSDFGPPFFSDGDRSQSHHPEETEHGELSKISTKDVRGQTNPDPCFASGHENEELNLHPESAQVAEFSDISSEGGGRGTFLRVPEVAGRPGGQERLRYTQGNSASKMPRKKAVCKEGDSDRSPSRKRVPEHLEGVRKSRPCVDLTQPAKTPSYECSYCGKRWPCQSQLHRHVKIHTGERPHKCPDCGKSFSNSSNLSQHKRVHTGERPYSCKDCGKSYRRRASLVQHEREACQKGNPLNAPAVGYIVLGNCTLLCMKKSAQSGKNRVIAPKGAEAPLAAQPLNLIMGYSQEKSQAGS